MGCFAVSIMGIRLVTGVDSLNNRNIKFLPITIECNTIPKYSFRSEGVEWERKKTVGYLLDRCRKWLCFCYFYVAMPRSSGWCFFFSCLGEKRRTERESSQVYNKHFYAQYTSLKFDFEPAAFYLHVGIYIRVAESSQTSQTAARVKYKQTNDQSAINRDEYSREKKW